MSVQKDQDKELEALKSEATELGVTFAYNIKADKLQEKIDEAIGVRANEATAKKSQAKTVDGGTKLNRIQLMRMKATALRKVKITNMARENQGSKTVFAGVHNMYLDISRVMPLNTILAVEQALLDNIESRKQLMEEEVLDKNGNGTGNYKSVSSGMYQIVYLDEK